MPRSELNFTVTGRGEIELLAESKGIAWIVVISKGAEVRFVRNSKTVDSFPATPLTKRLVAATEAILPDATKYLEESWKQGRPWDTVEGREYWWRMKKTVESF
jgi:hypothetical protein